MLTSFLESQKTLILAQNSDMPLGILFDFVVNPDSGIFEAFWLKTPSGLQMISPSDVLQWRRDRILISDENDLTDSEHFPRIQEIIDREVPILKAKVFVGKKYVGRVKDFSFDTISPRILTLIVRSGFWMWGREYIIPRSRITKITEKGIFVSENILPTPEKKEEKTAPVPELD